MRATRRHALAGLVAWALARPALALPEPPVADIRRDYLPSSFGQLHVRIAEPRGLRAKTPPLVLLHQTPLSGRMFERIMSHLAKGRRVIAVDTLGSSAPRVTDLLQQHETAWLDAIAEAADAIRLINSQAGEND